jgi:hypothetical protein
VGLTLSKSEVKSETARAKRRMKVKTEERYFAKVKREILQLIHVFIEGD